MLNHLRESNSIILFGATIGVGADTLVRKYSVTDAAMTSIAHCVGASLVENLCDKACDELKDTIKNATYDVIVVDDDTFKFLEELFPNKDEITVLSLDETEKVNITYTVLEGDTLDKIAKENKVDKNDIIKLILRPNLA